MMSAMNFPLWSSVVFECIFGMGIYVSRYDVRCDGFEVSESVCDIVIFCVMVCLCCAFRRYVDAIDLHIFYAG